MVTEPNDVGPLPQFPCNIGIADASMAILPVKYPPPGPDEHFAQITFPDVSYFATKILG